MSQGAKQRLHLAVLCSQLGLWNRVIEGPPATQFLRNSSPYATKGSVHADCSHASPRRCAPALLLSLISVNGVIVIKNRVGFNAGWGRGDSVGYLPRSLPFFLAIAIPSRVCAEMRSASNSATIAKTLSRSRPVGLSGS